MPNETIADLVRAVWPGFSVHEDQTVSQLRQWIEAEIHQLNAAFAVLEDNKIVGPDGSRKLTDAVFSG